MENCPICLAPQFPDLPHKMLDCVRSARERGDMSTLDAMLKGELTPRPAPAYSEPGAEYKAIITYREGGFCTPAVLEAKRLQDALDLERGIILDHTLKALDKAHAGHASCNSAGHTADQCRIGICAALKSVIDFIGERSK